MLILSISKDEPLAKSTHCRYVWFASGSRVQNLATRAFFRAVPG